MATLTKPQYRLLTILSFLGVVQGLTWIVLSLICIIMFLDTDTLPDLPIDNPSYMTLWQYNVYIRFLYGNYWSELDYGTVTPEVFTIFMWIYFISNIIWVVISVVLARSINRIDTNPLNPLRCWGVITCFISFIDLLLVILLGVDYDECITRYPDATVQFTQMCTDIIIPVLTIAAKGFILWIFNVIFVYVAFKLVRIIQSGKNLDRRLLSTDRQLPRATLQGQGSSSNLYGQYPGSGGYVTPKNKPSDYNMWNKGPSRHSGYGSRSVPTSPYYANPQAPSFGRY